nr:MAG TPA: hypothetical protein [Caudoviricetes sp.]
MVGMVEKNPVCRLFYIFCFFVPTGKFSKIAIFPPYPPWKGEPSDLRREKGMALAVPVGEAVRTAAAGRAGHAGSRSRAHHPALFCRAGRRGRRSGTAPGGGTHRGSPAGCRSTVCRVRFHPCRADGRVQPAGQ